MFVVGIAVGVGTWVVKDIVAPDFLDVRRQARATQAQIAAEVRAQERAIAPTRRRIAAALLKQVRSMRRVLIHGEFSLEEWQHWHNEIKALVETPDGATALGEDYQPFVDALSHDQLCINIQANRMREWKEPADPESRSGRQAVRLHDAHTEETVASAILDFIPSMRALGIADADQIEHAALQAIDLAHHVYRERPF